MQSVISKSRTLDVTKFNLSTSYFSMKKLLLLAFVSLTAMAGMAQTTKNYTDQLSVDKGAGKPYTATVERTAEGKFNLTIRNFYYKALFLNFAIGNIELKDIPYTVEGNIIKFEGDIKGAIVPGDDSKVKWQGPTLMANPQIKISGKVDSSFLYFTAQIPTPIGSVTTVFGTEALVTSLGLTPRAAKADVIYSLDGRRLDRAPEHGVYILNGKKVMK